MNSNNKITKIFSLKDIPSFSSSQFENYLSTISSEINIGKRVVAHFAVNNKQKQTAAATFYTIISNDSNYQLEAYSAQAPTNLTYSSLTPNHPQMHMFEREIYEDCNIKPIGHPFLKSVRSKLNDDHLQIKGDEIHEVAVGPVHAGIIEPGHFRFQCHGEKVFHLEISLGYQHRGIEKELVGGPYLKNIYQLECVAGDTTIGHSWAYCENIENLALNNSSLNNSSFSSSCYYNLLRSLMLELERLANHVGDLGALANDVGSLPTSSYCGRIRGDYLNLTAYICGNRFGRSMLTPFATNFTISNQQIDFISHKLDEVYRDTIGATNLLWNHSTILSRFENTGIVDFKSCVDLGIVGVAARAAGVQRDCRKSYQKEFSTHYQQLEIATCNSGDVWARAYVRKKEIDESIKLIKLILNDLMSLNNLKSTNDQKDFAIKKSPHTSGVAHTSGVLELKPDQMAISLIEGWRGEICHVAITDCDGKFAKYKIIDPSFHNWTALAISLRGEEISDFPLCNKSFNLSYCGFDL